MGNKLNCCKDCECSSNKCCGCFNCDCNCDNNCCSCTGNKKRNQNIAQIAPTTERQITMYKYSSTYDSFYKDKVNTYTAKGNELTFKCQANRVKNDTETEKTTITIVYKDHLPAKYTTKTGDSSDIWTYKFGKASFEFKEKTNESN